ncbi:hypothetical protein [Clostridioides difficile]|uniref:hypothetical protein n=1 Tax=Clostridioides difficile TaxID=1496 RepID=UPI0020B2075F|nr:hypothetical protein [Clostridioides difficile]
MTPFGILNDKEAVVKVVFDKDLLKMDKIGIHPNDNTAYGSQEWYCDNIIYI